MDDILQQLNEQQKLAVTTTEGYVRVIAGAGSGKTRALTARYAYLVEELGISPGRIMSATFTNKAANEMKHRIRKMLGDVDMGFISTFHGFCLRVLKDDIHRLNYPQAFAVMDEEDQKTLLQEIYEELGLKLRDYTFKNMLNIIGYYKTSYDYVGDLTQPDEQRMRRYFDSFNDGDTKQRVLGKYIQKQRKNFMLDFDDIINFVLYLFTHDKESLAKWQEQLQYIQVDEFQDVDAKQAELCYMLSEKYGNLFVVGDPDQTIYSWRGADVSIILDFDKRFPSTKTIVMKTNYRSSPQILDVSNSLIRHNELRLEKELQAVNEPGLKVKYFHAKTATEEAAFIVKQIKALQAGGTKLHDIALLYRAHYLSRTLEEAFVAENIPYVLYNGVEFYRRKEIKDVLCYLRMLVAADDISFLRTVNIPRRNIGKKRIEFLRAYAEKNFCTLYEAMNDNLENEIFAGTKAADYVRLIGQYKQRMADLTVSDLLDGILRDSGYEEKLMKDADQDRIDNVSELKNSIQEYESSAGEETSLDDYLNKIALFTNLDTAERADSVRMMTVHTAKGLEFPVVFVVGMNEGIFPGRRIQDREEMEEERRLAYVAFTRAGRRLFITETEGENYDNSYRYPSRFIFNVEAEMLDVEGLPHDQFIVQSKQYIQLAESRLLSKNSLFAAGDAVSHPVFGMGRVESVLENSYMIHFDQLNGSREIEKSYAKLVKI